MMDRSRIFIRRLQSVLLAVSLLLAGSLSARAQATATQPAPDVAKPRYEAHASQQRIDSSIPEDKAVLELIAPYAASLKEKMNVVVGFAPKIIKKDGPAAGSLGRLIADIVRQTAATSTGHKIDLAIQNAHGLRTDEIPAGQITVETIYQLMPFDNQVAVVDMSGADLLAFFDSMESNGNSDAAAVSGAQLIYRGGKLVSAKIGDRMIEPQATYTVGLIDYLYLRGGEYSIFQRGKNFQNTGIFLRDAIINYIRAEQAAGRQIVGPSEARIITE